MNEYDDIANEIRELALSRDDMGSHLDLGPATEEQVQRVEKELGVRLPASYRAYLLHFAGSLILGREMYGIPTPASAALFDAIYDIVEMNRDLADKNLVGSVLFASDGGDFWLYLDTTQMDAGLECPVVAWGPGAPGIKVADSFLDYVRKRAEGTACY